MCVVALASVVTLAGCTKKTESKPAESEGPVEHAGAAVDRSVEKTKDAAKATVAATKDTTGKVVEKTGAVLEKTGDAVENAGASMQDATTDK